MVLSNPFSTDTVTLGQMASQTSGMYKGPPAACFTHCSEDGEARGGPKRSPPPA